MGSVYRRNIMKTNLPHVLSILLCMAGTAYCATLEVNQARSRIQVDAKATGHDFTCTLEKYTMKASGNGSTLAPESLELNWNFSDLKTAEEDRDAAMIKWLGGGKPQGSFKFVKYWTDNKGTTNAQGTLTINGVSKTIYFPFTVKKTGEWATIDGKVSMDYQNFNLPVVRALAVMTVDPKLAVRFHIVGKVK